jgi:predicted HD superfamily hydrolase involved in NAD metabolism
LTGVRFVEIARDVRDALGQDHRYAHVVRVARLAGRLAHRHGEDPARARLAGLLHDLARLYTAERLLAECETRGMPIDAFEGRNPIVLHARLGAELARERFGVDDPGVHSAICRHTVAAPRMSRLDTIVYLADGLEPGRHFAEREGLLALAFRDLDAALAALLRSTLAYLEARNLETAPQTVAALAHLDALERTPLSA